VKIRLLKGAYAGLVCDHSPHAAHELIRRGMAEQVVLVPVVVATPEVEHAVVPEPEHVEHATKRRKGRR
jgi:hypothetical protein